jgi:hypothetical protein
LDGVLDPVWAQPKPLLAALNFCPGSAHPLGESQSSKREKECLEPPG